MSGFWRKCRVTFRWLRYAVWLLVLTVIGAFLWLNRVGLPDFLKTSLVANLHERGVNLEFSRMRLHLVHGFVAENVQATQTIAAGNAAFSAREVQLKLNLPALLYRQVQVDGIVLHDGKVELILSPTNTLTVTNLHTELRFDDQKTWSLSRFNADFNGAKIDLSGEIRHAPEMRNWPLFAGAKTADHGALPRLLKSISAELQNIHLEGLPQLHATVDGDARDVNSFSCHLTIQAPGAQTPWFTTRDLELTATLTAPTNAPTDFDSSWGFWTNAQPFRLTWTARAAELQAEKLAATTLECNGHWNAPDFAVTRLSAQLGDGKLAASANLNVATRAATFTADSSLAPAAIAAALTDKIRAQLNRITWTQPPELHASGGLTVPPWNSGTAAWQKDILPTVRLHGELAITNVVADGIPLDFARTQVSYTNRVWGLPDLELAQGKTKLSLSAAVHDETKNFTARGQGTITATTVKPFLPTNSLAELNFTEPLALTVAVAGNFYDWELIQVAGCAALTNFTVYRSPLDYVQVQFTHTNHGWSLPNLTVVQGETKLQVSGEISQATKDFQGHIHGTFDAASVTPFLTTSNAINGFAYLQFTEPLALAVNVTGNLRAFGSLAATGQLALTNFSCRRQTVENLITDLSYTNLTVDFLQPRLSRAAGTQTAAADKVTLDLAGKRLFLVNATGHVEPMVICRCIGPKSEEVMSAYQFPLIPQSRANGCIPLRFEQGELVTDDADIKFDIVGTTPFRWRKFETPAITGTIHWLANDLILTNVVSECYGGEARGWAVFNLHTPGEGTDLHFLVNAINVDFHRMGLALWSPTNKLEGMVAGTVMVTSANSSDWQTWDGYGDLSLQDGILWDVPIIGLISPMLNVIVPGLGNNRAKEAAGSFVMTNGVIRTDSLKIHTTTMQLEYNGTVDLLERVEARVTAQLLRTTPVLGALMSTVLWPVSKVLECRVTGTLGQPTATPIYVPFPKLLTAPLHPLRTLEELFNSPAPPPTNAPAAAP